MWRSLAKSFMVAQSNQLEGLCIGKVKLPYSTMVQVQKYERTSSRALESNEDVGNHNLLSDGVKDTGRLQKLKIGENVSRKDKYNFLVKTLLDLQDNKEAVYGALDAWVAWEQEFPIGWLRRALIQLEKQQQWHRIIQVIKWMLSKGQGRTMGTYSQLIRALDMDHRAEEAHRFWTKRIGIDLHSVPCQLCSNMISIYYRNNMLGNIVKLFKDLEAFDRKPDKSIVQKVADAYELLGFPEEKERILSKYNYLFVKSPEDSRKYRRSSSKKGKK